MTVAPPASPVAALPDPSAVLQLVYISARPELIGASIASFRAHYDADRALILTADGMKDAMEAVLAATGLAGLVIEDSEVLPGQARLTDHAERNCRLREALYRHGAVEPFFLSLDDDCILLRPLPADHFVSQGRMVARYSHPSLARWKSTSLGEPTSFDRQQWNTAGMLAGAGLPELGFAAHQAQIVEKASVNAVFAEFLQRASGPVDEWALYFNAVCARQPDRFMARPTTTLFWPERFDAWMPDWFDEDVHFENRYPWLYGEGGALARSGLAPHSDWRSKRMWAAASYAAHHGQRMLNELANGALPALQLERGTAGEPRASCGARQLFGFQGMLLKLAVANGQGERQPVEYAVVKDGVPAAESVSPRQHVGPRSDLAIRLPSRPGEYSLAIKWVAPEGPSYLSLPLFVLPYPRLD